MKNLLTAIFLVTVAGIYLGVKKDPVDKREKVTQVKQGNVSDSSFVDKAKSDLKSAAKINQKKNIQKQSYDK